MAIGKLQKHKPPATRRTGLRCRSWVHLFTGGPRGSCGSVVLPGSYCGDRSWVHLFTGGPRGSCGSVTHGSTGDAQSDQTPDCDALSGLPLNAHTHREPSGRRGLCRSWLRVCCPHPRSIHLAALQLHRSHAMPPHASRRLTSLAQRTPPQPRHASIAASQPIAACCAHRRPAQPAPAPSGLECLGKARRPTQASAADRCLHVAAPPRDSRTAASRPLRPSHRPRTSAIRFRRVRG